MTIVRLPRLPRLRSLAVLLTSMLLPTLALAQAPSIVTQPQNASVVSGSDLTLSVTATGAAPLSYRWQLFGTNLPNRTNATLLLTNVALNNGGFYTVIVTNSSGVITSAVTLVNVDEHLTFRILQL